jgi:hypothetical protein
MCVARRGGGDHGRWQTEGPLSRRAEEADSIETAAVGLWLHEDEIRRQAGRAWSKNFDLLRAHYGIGPEDPEHWQKLALCLISDHERRTLGVFLKSYGFDLIVRGLRRDGVRTF